MTTTIEPYTWFTQTSLHYHGHKNDTNNVRNYKPNTKCSLYENIINSLKPQEEFFITFKFTWLINMQLTKVIDPPFLVSCKPQMWKIWSSYNYWFTHPYKKEFSTTYVQHQFFLFIHMHHHSFQVVSINGGDRDTNMSSRSF